MANILESPSGGTGGGGINLGQKILGHHEDNVVKSKSILS